MREEFSLKINIETMNVTPLNINQWLSKAPFFDVISFQADDIKKYREPANWRIVNLNEVFANIKKK
ncbi:hypothetical protein ACE3MZ_17420 [Paenibacillus sp. WLX1005]|uniref:hypothetical protein n=1 Tax=Paenibacillus sp. WLX1005 TaxID=3243766 RepID=UPI003983F9D0